LATIAFTIPAELREFVEVAGNLVNECDVRELATWKEPAHPPYLDTKETDTPENRKAWDEWHKSDVETLAIKSAIIEAINQGLLKKLETD
jgi:hypothetical protein